DDEVDAGVDQRSAQCDQRDEDEKRGVDVDAAIPRCQAQKEGGQNQFVRKNLSGGRDQLKERVERPHQQPIEFALVDVLGDAADLREKRIVDGVSQHPQAV